MTREEAKVIFEDLRERKITLSDLSVNEQEEICDMAISALSADGEYIKKEDLFNKTIKRNSIWNGTTNAEGKGLEEIVNDLPTYTFPDSAENKGEWKKIWRTDAERSEYICSKCDCGEDYVTDFCPNCGADMKGK